jgi:glycosyltransferase involved in cell wall biosynthesis
LEARVISVVVPSYNHAAFISQALQSVVRQSYGDWEAIVIDDGSTDNSVEVARSFGDPRVRVEETSKNIGAYATENRGLEMARGEFVAILNSDDAWAPEKLALQMAVFERHPDLELCYTLGTIVDGRSEPMPGQDHHLDYPREEIQDVLPHLFRVNRVLASSVLFRRGATRFDPDLRYSGDWTALLAVAQRGPVGFVQHLA